MKTLLSHIVNNIKISGEVLRSFFSHRTQCGCLYVIFMYVYWHLHSGHSNVKEGERGVIEIDFKSEHTKSGNEMCLNNSESCVLLRLVYSRKNVSGLFFWLHDNPGSCFFTHTYVYLRRKWITFVLFLEFSTNSEDNREDVCSTDKGVTMSLHMKNCTFHC